MLLVGLTGVAIVYMMPSLVSDLPQFWTNYLPAQRVHLGLDLQGGTHLVMTVDIEKALENSLDHNIDDLKKELADAKVAVDGIERKGNRINVRIGTSEAR